MRLSFNLEYSGDCCNVLNFYASVFGNAYVQYKTFHEMDMADALGITGPGLDMVWQSNICIPYADSVLCLEMADSLMAAMQKGINSFPHFYYNPVICILHDDENYMHSLFRKLYGDQTDLKDLQDGKAIDLHGIRWQYQKSDRCGIFYCLTFDGFCSDVLAFYEDVFQIKATEIVTYRDSPYGDQIPGAGADKIYSTNLHFRHGNHAYALKLRDSFESALNGTNGYDPNALLFYQGQYNPVFTLRDNDKAYLDKAFKRLMNGAKLNRPMTPGDNDSVYGSLIDKYGICWNFNSVMEASVFDELTSKNKQ